MSEGTFKRGDANRRDPHAAPYTNSLATRRWSVEEWMNSEGVWAELLAQSDADALFLSLEWLTQWWSRFGATRGSANILGFYRGERLVGVAPFYERSVWRLGVVPTHSVQLIGHSFRDSTALISEYLDVIARRGEADAVRHACLREVSDNGRWSELAIGYTSVGGQWKAAVSGGTSVNCYVRELDKAVSYQADLTCGFGGYLRDLGQSTRRSVWNLRRRLAAHDKVSLEFLAPDEIDGGFSDLNRLHHLRWKRPAFTGNRLVFHTTLARRLATRGELAFSRLRVGGEVVSVLYDIRKGARQYNLKMGFDPGFNSSVSLGLLHLGYAMEAAADHCVAVYDFLAGPGQKSDYKRNLSQTHRDLSCVQMVRGRLLPSLYRWRDHAR